MTADKESGEMFARRWILLRRILQVSRWRWLGLVLVRGLGCALDVKTCVCERLIGIGAPVNISDFSYLEKCSKPKLFVHGSEDEFGDTSKLKKMIDWAAWRK